jgi:hypothetical protein
MPASKKPSGETQVSQSVSRYCEEKELTSTHFIIFTHGAALIGGRCCARERPHAFSGSDGTSSRLDSTGEFRPFYLNLTRAACLGCRHLAVADTQGAADLEEIALESINEALRLAVLTGNANSESIVLDDVSDAKTIS